MMNEKDVIEADITVNDAPFTTFVMRYCGIL